MDWWMFGKKRTIPELHNKSKLKSTFNLIDSWALHWESSNIFPNRLLMWHYLIKQRLGGEVLACRVLVPKQHIVDLFHGDNFKTLAPHQGARVKMTLVLGPLQSESECWDPELSSSPRSEWLKHGKELRDSWPQSSFWLGWPLQAALTNYVFTDETYQPFSPPNS